jgi:ATP-dependent Clp protease ATP-binding subunit ClpC
MGVDDGSYSASARRALDLADQHAREFQHRYLGNEHLLLGLLTEDHGRAAWYLHTHGVDEDEIRERILIMIGRGPTKSLAVLPSTADLQQTLTAANARAAQRGQNALVDTDDLLVPILTGHRRSSALNALIWPRADPARMARELDRRRRYEQEPGST